MDRNVILEWRELASRRTKNRIKEHGPNFLLVEEKPCQALGNVLSLLLRSETGSEVWTGWIPKAEVIVREVED